jgi:hypothetical protein
VVAVHQEVTFLHFSHAVPDLESTDPKIAAVKNIENYKSPVFTKFIACNLIVVLTCLPDTVGIVLQFQISSDWEIPEYKCVHKY